MKYLQFLIFISGSVFTFSQENLLEDSGQTGGIEVFRINRTADLHKLNKVSFSSEFSYIVLRTEYNHSVSTDNVSSVAVSTDNNKKGKMKLLSCFGCGSFEKIEQEEREMNFRYTIYYIITVNRENYEMGLSITVDYVATLFDYLKKRTNQPVTIIRERHEIESKELQLLLPDGNTEQTSEVISDRWRRCELVQFDNNLLSRLYKLTLFQNIEELPASLSYINGLDAFVAYYDTKLIAFTTDDEKLQEYTNNFIEFIQRCSNEELEVYKVENFNSLFQNTHHFHVGKQEEAYEPYLLYEYNNLCDIVGTINTNMGLRKLSSRDIKNNRHYILENRRLNEMYIFIKPSINTNTLKCMLKKETFWNSRAYKFKIRIFQTHKLNISVLLAFKDLTRDLLNNDVTDNVRKFITVCKAKYWYNPSIELPGSTSSVP